MFTWLIFSMLSVASASSETLLAEGMTAQRAGDTETAIVKYTACIQGDSTNVPCRWELGWTYWSLGQWDAVVEHWEAVAERDPQHKDLDKYLSTARDHQTAMRKLAALRAGAPATVRPPVASGKTLRLRAVGDIMLGTDFPAGYLPPDDGAKLLDAVAPLLRDADVTFGNLEGPLCDGGETAKCRPDSTACYAFRTPTRYGTYLKDAGFDLLSTANNHAGDFGRECRDQTHSTLNALGIAWSGPPGTIATVKAAGFTIGMIGFHTSKEVNDVNDHATAKLLVQAAKRDHDLVIVSFHGGAEGSKALRVPDATETFYGENRGHLRKFARDVIGAGADLVLGHGPHVPRGFELIDGHLVAYSLGNFATYGRFSLDGHLATTLVLEVVLDHEGKLVSGTILPVRLEGKGVPALDANNTATDLIRDLSTKDFGEAAPLFGQDGSFAPR